MTHEPLRGIVCPVCNKAFIYMNKYIRKRDGMEVKAMYCKTWGCGWRKIHSISKPVLKGGE